MRWELMEDNKITRKYFTRKKICVFTLNCHNYSVKTITLMSRAQQDHQELWYEQRGPLTVVGPPNRMRGITAATAVPE